MNFLKTIVLVLSIVGYLGFISTRISNGVYKAPFIYCCVTSLLIYFFGLIGLLEVGALLSLGIGLIFLCFNFRDRFKRLLNALIDNPWLLLILVLYVLFYISIQTNFQFLTWDEFSFWASSSKIIATTDALFNEHSPIFFKSYPPIQQLFQYHFTKFGFWSEKNILYAQIFWSLSAILCCVGSLVSSKKWVPCAFLIACPLLYFFDYSYTTVYSDALLGLCFAATLGLAYSKNDRWDDYFAFFLCTGTLLLLKEIAITLAFVATIIFIALLPWRSVSHTNRNGKEITRLFLTCLAGLGLLFVVRWSWSWYVAKINATRDVVFPKLSSFLTEPLSTRIEATLKELVHRSFESDYLVLAHISSGHRPAIWLSFLSLIILSGLIVLLTPKNERLRIGFTLGILQIGCLTYLFALLVSYIVIFTEYEGVRLASFERYFSSYMIASTLILFAFSFNLICKLSSLRSKLLQVFLAVLIFYFVPTKFFSDLISIESSGPDYRTRQTTEALAAEVKKYIQSNQKVYFIAQNSNGLERVMFYYAMLPYTSSMSWCWSIGKKYTSGDVWTCDVQLTDLLAGYDYLALYRVDQQFWDLNSKLFDTKDKGKNSGVFRILRSEGVIERFELLGN